MEETKFAELDVDKIEAIKQLEQKLDVTLIAYDVPNNSFQHEDKPIVINPS